MSCYCLFCPSKEDRILTRQNSYRSLARKMKVNLEIINKYVYLIIVPYLGGLSADTKNLAKQIENILFRCNNQVLVKLNV